MGLIYRLTIIQLNKLYSDVSYIKIKKLYNYGTLYTTETMQNILWHDHT
jgi:hypothetical protein